jgi:hypothetical protein
MDVFGDVPDWLGTAVAGAVLAVLGFVAKQIVESIDAMRRRANERYVRLVYLQSLLRAARVSFIIQNSHANRLTEQILARHHELVNDARGYESIMAKAFLALTGDEQDLHSIIRSMTIHSLKPINDSMLKWLERDRYYKSKRRKKGPESELARKLADLEAHLLLWRAKYEAWMPDRPEHALVYMADEQQHGLGFPSGLDGLVDRALGEPSQGEGRVGSC